MKMARITLFTGNMVPMSKFYGDVPGLRQVTNEKGWQQFAANGVRIALHPGPSSAGHKGPKLVLLSNDVAVVRGTLVGRRGTFSKVRQGSMDCRRDLAYRGAHSTHERHA